jgi:hypothetical protein
MRRIDCHSRIKEVRSNYETALQAVNVLIGMVMEQSAHPSHYDYNLPTLRSLARELHDVYFARMFACFESSFS